MINLKLVGKTLPEIIHMIIYEEVTDVTYHDGEYMEMLLQEYISQDDVDETTETISELEADIERLEDTSREGQEHIEYLENLLKENGIEY